MRKRRSRQREVQAVNAIAPYRTTQHGLIIDFDITREEWLECGGVLCAAYRGIKWAIGDWLAFGEDVLGEDYSQGLDVTDYEPQTLLNYACVSRAFPDLAYRARYEKLSHGHFEAVSARDIPFDKKTEFLQAALDNDMTRQDVRAAVKSWRGKAQLPEPWSIECIPDDPVLIITLPRDHVGRRIRISSRVLE